MDRRSNSNCFDYNIAIVAITLAIELSAYFTNGDEEIFSPKFFRKKYGIPKWAYWKALDLLRESGVIQTKRRSRPYLNEKVKKLFKDFGNYYISPFR